MFTSLATSRAKKYFCPLARKIAGKKGGVSRWVPTSLLLASTMGTSGDSSDTNGCLRTLARNSRTTACSSSTWHRDALTEPRPTIATVSPATMAHSPMSDLPWDAGSMPTHTVCTESALAGLTVTGSLRSSAASTMGSGRYALNFCLRTPASTHTQKKAIAHTQLKTMHTDSATAKKTRVRPR